MKTNSREPIYGIGIDTGGTYTDAVLLDLREHQVISVSKRPTIHHCLERSIVQALDDIFPVDKTHSVRKISFSTTLATNAIAEGRISKVGLIVIGQVKPFDAPVVLVRYVEGGHDHRGQEVLPLNIEQIVDAVHSFKGHVDAYAIAASCSIENPTHEQVAAKAIELVDRKPVVCSNVVSSKSGIRERAATAVLHASLMPVIQGFVTQVNQLKKDRFVTADMRIIRGDAAADNLRQAVVCAASTVASGPAATAYFGARSAAAKLAMVVDIGGTTTDITFIKNGKPVISNEGSLIDRWQTHIDAVDMHTVGIGGDSLVRLNRSGRLSVGPLRVQPLAMSQGIPDPASWIGAENRSRWIIIVNSNEHDQSAVLDPVVAHLLREKGATPADMIDQLGMSDFVLDRRLEDLAFNNQISAVGFTPTDALHVLGKSQLGDAAASIAGARILADLRGETIEAFSNAVLDATHQKIANAILTYAFKKQTGKSIEAVTSLNQDASLVSCRFKLDVPIVGIGAAARHLLPEVADRLHTQAIFPSHFEVGNALGAIMIALNGER
ncbi:MAG: hydantoinase/oxoprolinase family protein [Desulfosarcina sp.]|jgi:N-methylhydantoinase A/oxoprolinase/acetone carboxylase beta subunit